MSETILELTGPIGSGVNRAGPIVARIGAIRSDTIRVLINSGGGDIGDGQRIIVALSQHPARTVAEIENARSMAAHIALCCNRVEMRPGATLMIHPPMTEARGRASRVRRVLDAMDRWQDGCVAIYKARTGQPESSIRRWMDEERVFTAREAVELGFADTILGTDLVRPVRSAAPAASSSYAAIAAASDKAYARAQYASWKTLNYLDTMQRLHGYRGPRPQLRIGPVR